MELSVYQKLNLKQEIIEQTVEMDSKKYLTNSQAQKT